MTITQTIGVLVILVICPILGMIPLIDWLTYALSGKELSKLGTGNISVSAAFYHGGKVAGILAVLSEAGKGIVAVEIARIYFPLGSTWEIIALIALVMGRYWGGKGAGATNVTWGIVFHNPPGALLIALIGGVSFTIWREKKVGRISILILMVVVLSAQKISDPNYIFMTCILAGLMIWIYDHMADDLDLNPEQVNSESSKMFNFFRGDKSVLSLNDNLSAQQVGNKAANLSLLKRWGYNVPDGWVIKVGDDLTKLVSFLNPSTRNLLVVRSSAFEEDTVNASAAGIYESFLHISNPQELEQAVFDCFSSYDSSIALDYRQQKQQKEQGIAVIIQKQVNAIYSGVAFSRDPINQLDDCVCIEAVSGLCRQVVSGEVTPEQYRVIFPDLTLEGEGNTPSSVILQVANIAREIEQVCQGVPQDIEWSYDGETLWLLQTRPITNLQPLWTRKIAAEVIPGVIRPLTWSVNKPLTCGVWGEIFTIVLGKKSQGLDFTQTATLHYHRAYFNATLLGNIFLLMGLPPESLEFLTRGSKFTKPPLKSTLINLPGLWRLLQKEFNLYSDFTADNDRYFTPILDDLKDNQEKLDSCNNQQLFAEINQILECLKKVTFYNILAPLSFSLRQAIFQVEPANLDYQNSPEVASVNELEKIAIDALHLLSSQELANIEPHNYAALFTYLAESTEGQSVLTRLEKWLDDYGYLSAVGTDISVPRWREEKKNMKIMFTNFLRKNKKEIDKNNYHNYSCKEKIFYFIVQKRLYLKGEVNRVYSQLLAHLRYHFLTLEKNFITTHSIESEGDIFFLRFREIDQYIKGEKSSLELQQMITTRKLQWQESNSIEQIPYLIYGNAPQIDFNLSCTTVTSKDMISGIPASVGIVEGKIKVVTNLTQAVNINSDNIIVVPYTDSGWSTILAQAGGLIAEVGGKLSHGAIIAREYKIPAVMDVHNATKIFEDGQLVRLNGAKGTVEILS